MTDLLGDIKKAMAEIEAMDDEFLKALAAIAAAGRFQIIPKPPALFGPEGKPILVVPQRMFDRMMKITAKPGGRTDE